ncbi:MAG: hypothetical protein JWN10_1046 [Solirubrobacterales bacterium]|nr:hypothetical protein [Solirubrobacterales bacterium]
MRRLAALQLCAAALLPALCVPARADVFGPISLTSDNALEQVNYAHDPAISGNGQYVAFDGYFEGLTGVWRRELQPPYSIEAVAVGEPETPAGSAELPSISENGQYVSFTTTAALSPKNDTNTAPDVYVRDMDVAESQPCEEETVNPAQSCAFTIASAVNGSTHGLSYEYAGGANQVYEEGHYGALAAGRGALSANGQEVVFVTTAPSNLTGAGTPQLQVAVRYLQTGRTELVSAEYDPATGRPAVGPEPVRVQGRAGAVYGPGAPQSFELPRQYLPTPQVPVSISADGSTVAWMAQDVGEQAPTLPGESLSPEYAEPLWRRIGDGEEAPTRRVTGGSDPANPACIAGGETVLPEKRSLSDPCQGPFQTTQSRGVWTHSEQESPVPRLSADGYTVAFIAQAPLVAFGSDFDVEAEARHSDLYVADMHEGLSRVQALTPITELASGNEGVLATNAPIVEYGVSPDGSQVAFTTMRTQFVLGTPAYVSAPAAAPGMLELFDADLADDTLTRVTHGYNGGPSEAPHEEVTSKEDQYVDLVAVDGALSPSFSDSGSLLAFSSTASNLVYGDGNTPPLSETETERSDGSDVFVVKRETFPADPAPQVISGVPPAPSLDTPWSLGVTAVSLADGDVRLYVESPGAGALRALASGSVVVASRRSTRAGAHHKAGHKAKGAHTRTTVAIRDVAAANGASEPSASGLTTLTLTLTASYRALAARSSGLRAKVSVTFSAPGHPTLHREIAVSFVRKVSVHAKARRAAHGKKRR